MKRFLLRQPPSGAKLPRGSWKAHPVPHGWVLLPALHAGSTPGAAGPGQILPDPGHFQRLLLKGAGGKETRGGRNLPWRCEQAARLWSPPRPRRASLGLDQTPRCCYCQRGGHSRSLEGPQTPLGSQTQPGSQNPLGFQIHPGSQTHLGSQTPPGSQTHSGSQTPMGSQPPPGSQTLPVPAATPGSREAGMSPCHFPARVYIPLRCRCR